MSARTAGRFAVLLGGENLALIFAVAAAAYVRLGDAAWFELSQNNGAIKVLLVVVVCQVSLYYADLYELRRLSDATDLLIRLFQALGATSMILAFVYFMVPEWIIGRGVFVLAVAFVIV